MPERSPRSTDIKMQQAPKPALSGALRPPTLIEPASGAGMPQGAVTLRWEEIPEASGYWLQMASDQQFNDILFESYIGPSGTITLHDRLPNDASLVYWRMRSGNQEGWGPFSAPHALGRATEKASPAPASVPAKPAVQEPPTLVVRPAPPADPSVPALLAPLNDAPVDGSAVSLDWTEVEGAGEYHLQVASDADFNDLWFDTLVVKSTSVTVYQLFPQNGATLFWRVRARPVNGGWKPWSAVGQFRATNDDAVEAYNLAQSKARHEAALKQAAPEEAVGPFETMNPVETGRTSAGEAMTALSVIVLSFVILLIFVIAISF